MADAALVSALEGRPLDLRGARGPRAGRARRGCCARSTSAASASSSPRPRATAALALGDRTVLLVEAPPPTLRRAPARRGPTSPAPQDTARRRRQVPALDGADRRGRRGRPARRHRARRRDARAGRPRPRRAPGVLVAARRARRRGSRPATAGRTSWCPSASASCCSRSRAYLRHRDRVLSDWGYERTVARTQGLKVLFAGESGTGKTMAAAGARRRARAGDLPRRPRDDRVSKYIGETEKNLDRIFGAAEGSNAILFFDEADALFGKRSEVSRLARPLREHRGRLPAAEDGGLRGRGHPRHQLPPQHRRRVRAPAGLRDRLPVPGGRGPQADLASCCCPSEAPLADDVDLDFLADAVQALRRRDPQLLAVGRVPGRRRRRRRSRCATSCARSRRSTASRAGSRSRPTSSSFHDVIKVGAARR